MDPGLLSGYSKYFDSAQKNNHKESQGNKNSGLGLAIVKSIALRHHGNVWPESELGKAVLFTWKYLFGKK